MDPVISSQRALKTQQAYNVQPPIQLVPNNSAVVAYDSSVEKAPLGLLLLQNVGTAVLKVCIDNDATANLWHLLVAPGTGVDDGLGSTIDLSSFNCKKVSVFCAAAGRVSVFKAYANI